MPEIVCHLPDYMNTLHASQCRVVIPCRRFGTTHRSHLEGSSSPRKILRLLHGMVWNYRPMLRKIPEERRSHVFHKLQSGKKVKGKVIPLQARCGPEGG
jgi:hypothetical protein